MPEVSRPRLQIQELRLAQRRHLAKLRLTQSSVEKDADRLQVPDDGRWGDQHARVRAQGDVLGPDPADECRALLVAQLGEVATRYLGEGARLLAQRTNLLGRGRGVVLHVRHEDAL